MPPIPGMMQWHSLIARHARQLKAALTNASRALDAQLSGKSATQLEPLLARNTPKHPLHPLARIRQGQNRWYSTARRSLNDFVREFSTSSSTRVGSKFDRASFPKSRISSYISQSSGRAPFASTLRPNLTGGTLGRTAGGYSLGSGRAGSARYFSHGPACQAHVVQNVSQAVRAFLIGGQKAQFDGTTSRGEKKFKAVTPLQEETGRKMRTLPKATPGSWVDFKINPTITALTPLAAVTGFCSSVNIQPDHLNSDGLLDVLSVDFSRTLKDLAAVLNDLKRLSILGDLPLTQEGTHLRVHFPGCDRQTVESLCEELHVTRGTVIQDENFDAFVGTEMALLFPFAPSADASETDSLFDEPPPIYPGKRSIDLGSMLSRSKSPAYSMQSDHSFESIHHELSEGQWHSSGSGFETVRSGSVSGSDLHSPLEYQGFEGIYRFMEELDSARR